MKNIFKKNQIIITALAIMIVIAGYLHFVENKSDKGLDVSTKDTIDYDTYKETADDDITDGDLVSVEGSDLLVDNLGADIGEDPLEDTDEFADISDEDTSEVAQFDVSDNGEIIVGEEDESGEEVSTPGEAILVNTTLHANFFITAKLEREQLRALNRERFMEIIEDVNLSEDLKSGAVNGLLDLTQIAEKENKTETLLEAKGFEDVVVSISEGSVDVIVNAVTITEQDIAKIEDIVKRKTGATAAEIFISAVVIGE